MSAGDGAEADLLDIARHAFAPDRPDRVGVAVSGGSDSVALLDLLAAVRAEAGWALRAVTVDHGLRPEAGDEARAVAAACGRLGVPHDILRWSGWGGTGNLQAAARAARYALIAGWAEAGGVAAVALGHTRDDNVESFVMGLARGAGLDGLSGMRPRFTRGAVTFVRPLLGIPRARLRDHLRRRGIGWSEDPSNEDDRFDRVRIRHALAAAGVDHGRLAASIANLRRTRAGLDEALGRWAAEHAHEDRGDLVLDPAAFAALPQDFARRVLNAALRWVAAADYPPRAERVLCLLDAPPGPRGRTLHGCVIASTPRGLLVRREPRAAVRAPAVPTTAVWDGRWRLDGPHDPALRVAALGAPGLADCPGWREAGLPRASLLASPAIWAGERLVAAPLAGRAAGWTARVVRPFAAMFAPH